LPGLGVVFQPYTIHLMMVLLFLSFVSTELKDIGKMIRSGALLVAWLSFLKLIAMPMAVYVLLRLFRPEYAVGGLLLAGTSTAVIAPFISELVSGNTPLVLVMSVLSSLLVPFTLPLMVEAVAGRSIDIPLGGMIRLLAMVVFVPVLAKEILARFFPRVLSITAAVRFPFSLACMAMVTIGIFSKYADYILENPSMIVEATLIGAALGAFAFVAGLSATWKMPTQDQAASVITLGNINNMLIIVFAGEFFGPLGPTLAAMYIKTEVARQNLEIKQLDTKG
ncbi:MAG: bile acid:sodium symporter, partial [Deltaproteobacteria bacterium]|nr:bile acid:sodium symporter [Deltaproteobacteria bacterium]